MRTLCFSIILFISTAATAQLKTWSFRDVDSLMKEAPKPVFVFIQTSWCTYCQLMKERTFKDEQIISLLNDRFYFIAFNAEDRNDIQFRGQRFRYKSFGNKVGVNELASALGSINGRIAYPGICILNKKDEIIMQRSGFLTAPQLIRLLGYISTN